MSRLISVQATLLVELNIKDGAPTVYDIVNLIKRGKFSLEVYEPIINTEPLPIVMRELLTKQTEGE